MAEVRPIGYVVLVEPEKIKETSDGGIVLVTAETKKYEQQAQVRGKVLAIGDLAFDEQIKIGLEVPVQVGDIVYYQRHAGMRLTDDHGNIRLDRLLLKDLDIVAVVEN